MHGAMPMYVPCLRADLSLSLSVFASECIFLSGYLCMHLCMYMCRLAAVILSAAHARAAGIYFCLAFSLYLPAGLCPPRLSVCYERGRIMTRHNAQEIDWECPICPPISGHRARQRAAEIAVLVREGPHVLALRRRTTTPRPARFRLGRSGLQGTTGRP